MLSQASRRSLGLFIVCVVVSLALAAALVIVVSMLRNRIRRSPDKGAVTGPVAYPDRMQFDVAAMKAWEFYEAAKAAKSSYVDNRLVGEWKERYASSFEVLKNFPEHEPFHPKNLNIIPQFFG